MAECSEAFWRRVVTRFDRLCKPQVSVPRQLLAASLAAVVLRFSMPLYERVPYWLDHFLAFIFLTLLGYAISGSWRIGWPLLTAFILGNEFVVDLNKANHPNVDGGQIAAGFAGIALASCFLGSLNRWLPGRPWRSSAESKVARVRFIERAKRFFGR